MTRSELWNKAEASEARINSVLGREIRIALPENHEIAIIMAADLSKQIAEIYRVAVDLSCHESGKDGDERNVHAHILITSRPFDAITGEFSKKKDRCWNGKEGSQTITNIRKLWSDVYESHRNDYGLPSIDHRSNLDRGILETPSKHLGHTRTAMLRNGKLATPEEPEELPLRRTYPELEKLKAEAAQIAAEIAELKAEYEEITEEIKAAEEVRIMTEKLQAGLKQKLGKPWERMPGDSPPGAS